VEDVSECERLPEDAWVSRRRLYHERRERTLWGRVRAQHGQLLSDAAFGRPPAHPQVPRALQYFRVLARVRLIFARRLSHLVLGTPHRLHEAREVARARLAPRDRRA
jgi:hypothetical protein